MPAYSMYVYPWDLRDEGVAEVAARLREANIDSVSLTASYHAGKFLRPHGPRGKIYFPEDGTVYFRPSARHYRVLKPLQAQMARSFDAFGELAVHASDNRSAMKTASRVPRLSTSNEMGLPSAASMLS